MSGLTEAVFENVSLENLSEVKKFLSSPNRTVADTLKKYAVQAGVEGSEELFTDCANFISDQIINGDQSELNSNIAAYEAQGLSAGEAIQKALLDFGGQLTSSFAGGFVSGGLMAGGAHAVAAVQNMTSGHTTRGTGLMVNMSGMTGQAAAFTLDHAAVDSAAYQAAVEVVDLLEAGKTPSAQQTGQMLQGGVQAYQQGLEQTLQAVMTDSGLTQTQAQAMTDKLLSGDTLSDIQAQQIRDIDAVRGAVSETLGVELTAMDSVEEIQSVTQDAAGQAFSVNGLLSPYTEAGIELKSRAEYGRMTAELEAQVKGYTGGTLQAYEAGQAYAENLSPEEYAIGFDFYHSEGALGMDFETVAALADEAGMGMSKEAGFIAHAAGVNEANGTLDDAAYTDMSNGEGGIPNGTEETFAGVAETVEGSDGAGENTGGDRARETAQEASGGTRVVQNGRIGISNPSFGEEPYRAWAKEGIISPHRGSVSDTEQQVTVEYGVPSFVVADEVFDKHHNVEAFSINGQVYFRETIDADKEGRIAKHEINHVMRQVSFQPYLDFLDNLPDRLNMHSEEFQEIADHVSKHTGIDPLDMTAAEQTRFFDELNATIYSHIAVNDTTILEAIRPAFVDWDAYIADIQGIHEQFKESRSVDPLLMQTALDAVDTQDQIRQWEDEFSQWNRQAQLQQARPALEQLAGQYNDANTAQAFVQGYDGGLPLNVYQRGFDQVYQMAQQGYSLADVMSQADHHMLTTEQADLAYQAGAAEFEAEVLQNGGDGGRLGGESWEESSEDNLDGELKYWEKLLGKLKDNVKIQVYNSAESINSWWASRDYTDLPYTPNTIVLDIQLTQDTIFVRVYDNKVSGLKGGWIMRANDIDGLTPKQIQEKFALPSIPVYIGEVRLM